MLPADCTVAHVFEHLQDLERQAGEEVGLQEYHLEFNFKGPFSSGRREEYFPVIKRALGIRHFAVEDNAEDAAFAERHSTTWHYFVVRPTPDRFTIIKARSPSPCPNLVLQMAGLGAAYNHHVSAWENNQVEDEDDEDYDECYADFVFVPCRTASNVGERALGIVSYTTEETESATEPSEGLAVACRLWRLALSRGGSVRWLSAKAAVDHTSQTGEGEESDAKEPWIRIPGQVVAGARVQLQNIVAQTELNGQYGELVAEASQGSQGEGRWKVRVDGRKKKLLLKPKKFKVMNQVCSLDLWLSAKGMPTVRQLALMRKLRAAARIVAPLLGLYKSVLEKTYAPSGAGFKRAHDDFDAHRQA